MRTAIQFIHVNVSPVNTATEAFSGATDFGEIGSGKYVSLNYGVKNESTKLAYVFIRIEMATPRLYDVVGSSSEGVPVGWCRVSAQKLMTR